MTTEELVAMEERIAKHKAQQLAVERAKEAIAEAAAITPESVAMYGARSCDIAMMMTRLSGHHKSLLEQAAEMHAQKFIDDIKCQLRAHLAVQEKKLAEI